VQVAVVKPLLRCPRSPWVANGQQGGGVPATKVAAGPCSPGTPSLLELLLASSASPSLPWL